MAVGAVTARDGQSLGNSTPKCGPDLRSRLSPNYLFPSAFKRLLENDTCLQLVTIVSRSEKHGGGGGGESGPGKNLSWPWASSLCDSGHIPTSAASVSL